MAIEHVVFLRLKAQNADEWNDLHRGFMALKAIPGVQDLSIGPNITPDRSGGAPTITYSVMRRIHACIARVA